MAYKTTDDDDHSEAVINQLAESVLGLSDGAIVEEIEETGAAPDEEAEEHPLIAPKEITGMGVARGVRG